MLWQLISHQTNATINRLCNEKIFLIFLSLVTTVGFTQVQRIKVKGNKFVNEKGEAFVFRGLNAGDPDKLTTDGHWNKEYFAEIKNWGANIVRFPVHPQVWRKRGQEEYMKLLDQGVAMAKELGLYVIIDWHSIGNLRSQLYQAPGYATTQKETFEFWRTMAQHYKNETTVAFFELFNEPTVYNGQLGTCHQQDRESILRKLCRKRPQHLNNLRC